MPRVAATQQVTSQRVPPQCDSLPSLFANPSSPSSRCLSSLSFSRATLIKRPMSNSQEVLQPSQESDASNLQSPYRKAKPIPAAVRTHCHIYFDESLYVNALRLLSDLVTLGAAHPECAEKPAFVPEPFHIELVSALLIHPQHTSQPPESGSLDLSIPAIRLLRSILEIIGPLNANLAEAFSFSPLSRISRRSRSDPEYSSDSDSEGRHDHVKGVIANKGRIRRCAVDFWHMVGWSFNCSVKYPKRWKYWKVWLDYMLDVLDADWNERERLDQPNSTDNTEDFTLRRGSILVTYLKQTKESNGAVKRVVRSAFADAGADSLRDFPEVFKNETKGVNAQNGQKRKRASLGHSGNEGEILTSSETGRTPESQEEDEEDETPTMGPWLGGAESIALRQRVLTLLSRVAADIPEEFVDCRDLYEIIYACSKPLPLPAFALLVSPSQSSQIPVEALVSLCQLFLLRLLPNSAPRSQSINGQGNGELNQDVLEQCFLPFAASTSSANDNAKASILIESLFRLFLRTCECLHTPSLDEAVEKGILAREKQIKGDRRRKKNGVGSKEEEKERAWLQASAERLRDLRDMVEENENV